MTATRSLTVPTCNLGHALNIVGDAIDPKPSRVCRNTKIGSAADTDERFIAGRSSLGVVG